MFDYRHFGASAGEPRQLLDISKQQDDYRAAVGYARALDWVDSERVALFGTSFSGGHVLAVAAADQRIAAVVSQCPFTDGLASLPKLGAANIAKATVAGLRDQLAALVGRSAQYIPAVGPPGSFAVMTTPDAQPGFEALLPPELPLGESRRSTNCTSRRELSPRAIRGKDRVPRAVLRVRRRCARPPEGDTEIRRGCAARRDQALPGRPFRHLRRRSVGARRGRPSRVPRRAASLEIATARSSRQRRDPEAALECRNRSATPHDCASSDTCVGLGTGCRPRTPSVRLASG